MRIDDFLGVRGTNVMIKVCLGTTFGMPDSAVMSKIPRLDGKQLKTTAGLPISCTVGPRWEAVIIRSNFKSEAIFGFPSPNYTGHVT